MKTLILLVFASLSLNAFSQELTDTDQQAVTAVIDNSWTLSQKVKEGATLALLTIDYEQTRHIATDCTMEHHIVGHITNNYAIENEYIVTECIENNGEANPILGKSPNKRTVGNYFATVIITQFIIADVLPSKYRDYFLDGMITVEAVATAHNKAMHVSCKF